MVHFDLKVRKVTVQGNSAVTLEDFHNEWEETDPKTGQTHRKTEFGHERDTWKKTASGWKRQRWDELQKRTLTDSKPDKNLGKGA